MPEIIFLIGAPCSGKSTWISKFNSSNYEIVSTDNLVSWYGGKYNRSYDEVFNSGLMNAFNKIFFQSIKDLVQDKKNIIVDRTNTTFKTRENILSLIPTEYKKIAVYFDTPLDTLISRNKIRKQTGKTIPEFVIRNFYNNTEFPTTDEFDEIRKAE